ncbi:MAG: sulfotransferase family protein [Methylohalobius sp. ZOD2]
MKNTQSNHLPAEFIQVINDAAALLDNALGQNHDQRALTAEPLPSLLEQCEQLLTEASATDREPIRTIHHLACTGGTLITKCLAAMPNTQVLSEVDPLSTLHMRQPKPQFAPTDLIRLLRYSARTVDDPLLIDIFLGGITALYEALVERGERLIVRDHAHSLFCTDQFHTGRPSLKEMLVKHFPVRSVVTVRHPLDSFLSLKAKGWIHFDPPTLDEYCIRYTAFLDAYRPSTIVRYEDFVASPEGEMKKLCDLLDLPYDDAFLSTFNVFRLTGDSGRSGEEIQPRPRRPVSDELNSEISASQKYQSLCTRLGY